MREGGQKVTVCVTTDVARTTDELQTGQLRQGWELGHTEATGEARGVCIMHHHCRCRLFIELTMVTFLSGKAVVPRDMVMWLSFHQDLWKNILACGREWAVAMPCFRGMCCAYLVTACVILHSSAPLFRVSPEEKRLCSEHVVSP